MLNKLFYCIKKIVIAGFTLFVFNLMILPFNIVIPINIITVLFTTIFGVIALPFFTIMLIFFF